MVAVSILHPVNRADPWRETARALRGLGAFGKTGLGTNLGRRKSGVPQRGKGEGIVPLGQALPACVGNQVVVPPLGHGKIEQSLKQTVDVRGDEKVATARDQSDALGGVIENDGQVIAGRNILARQNDVAQQLGLRLLWALAALVPRQRPDLFHGLCEIETPGVSLAAFETATTFGYAAAAAGPGVKRSVGSMRRRAGSRDLGGNLLTRAKAGIDQVARFELPKGVPVEVETLRLAENRLFPLQAQPGEVPVDGRFEFRPATCNVDIFDTQQEAPAGVCRLGCEKRGMGMPQMQASAW